MTWRDCSKSATAVLPRSRALSQDALFRLAVCAVSEASAPAAQNLADRLSLPLLAVGTSPRDCLQATGLLRVDEHSLALQLCGRKMPGAVSVDFGAAGMRHRRGAGHNELLGKAVGIGRKAGLAVIDATGGLGRDSFVLADLGARVHLCERHPVIAALLQSGLDNAAASADQWLRSVAARMRFSAVDVRELCSDDINRADVIYLDPMFPQRDKAAAVKKEMVLFQFLLQDESPDADALLDWALQQSVARVVVKRPLKAEVLAGVPPSHNIRGKAVRYDTYVLSGLA